jgi:hypothetical protein
LHECRSIRGDALLDLLRRKLALAGLRAGWRGVPALDEEKIRRL